MSRSSSPLEVRFAAALSKAADRDAGGPWVVAVSGGLDSCVLLHLLRFAAVPKRPELVAAHYDHGLRPASRDDARWVAGLCRAWGLTLRVGRADSDLGSEDAARTARYDFLDAVRREVGAQLVLTAHHADDQAETVLFRLLRGSGQRGLSGIPVARDPAIFRPLLSFWREELEAHAERVGLTWREDASNRESRFARNVLRTRTLPEVERLVAPGARRALVRLARIAREEEAGWESLLPGLIAPLGVIEEEGRISVDRREIARLHPAVRARVLRSLGARLGLTLDQAVTRVAVEFASAGTSGSGIDLGRGVTLRRELDRLVLGPPVAASHDRPLRIPGPGPGFGDALLGGQTIPVAWGSPDARSRLSAERFDPELLRFPLCVRSRRPGDLMRLRGGSKKVKKLFLERRIPSTLRHRVPLVVDSEGEVLWIPGVARALPGLERPREALSIGIG